MAKAKPKTPTPPPAKSPAKTTTRPQAADDPALDAFTAGLAALNGKNWAQAVELLEKSVELADWPELRERARQLLVAARQKSGEAGGKKASGEEADPFLQAVFEKNNGNLKGALEIAQKGGRDQKDERFAFLVATIHAAEGRTEEAAQALTRAIELNPKNRVHAFHDPDFAEFRKNRDYRPLFGLS